MSASKILKIKDADGNLQRVSSTDETYLAYQAGKQMAASSGNSVGDLTMTGTPNRTIGSHTNTFYQQPVGTHPASQLTIGSTTSTLKQRTGSPSLVGAQYQPNGRDKYQQPITYTTLNDKLGIHPMLDDEFDNLVDRLNSIIATNDYVGSYKLAATAPSSDYTERFTLGTDTRTDGTSVDYKIWQRTSQTAPTSEVQPAFILDSDGYQGLAGMNNTEARWTLGQAAKGRRQISGNIGNYQLRSSVEGAPTDTGSWKNVGTALDTRNTTSDQIYTRSRVSTYTRERDINYEGVYVSEGYEIYTGDFTGDYSNYSRPFTGDFIGFSSQKFVGDFTTDYETHFQKDRFENFASNYVSDKDIDYIGTYAGDFIGTYTNYFEGNFIGQYEKDYEHSVEETFTNFSEIVYTGNFQNYVLPFTRDFVGNFQNYVSPFEGNYSNFASPYSIGFINEYTATYEEINNQFFIGNFTKAYDRHQVEDYQSTEYTGDYTKDYNQATQYAIGYVGGSGNPDSESDPQQFIRDYQRSADENFAAFAGDNFTNSYIGTFEALYVQDIDTDKTVVYTLGDDATDFQAYFQRDYSKTYSNFADPYSRNYQRNYNTVYTSNYERADYTYDHGDGFVNEDQDGYIEGAADQVGGLNINAYQGNFERNTNTNYGIDYYVGFVHAGYSSGDTINYLSHEFDGHFGNTFTGASTAEPNQNQASQYNVYYEIHGYYYYQSNYYQWIVNQATNQGYQDSYIIIWNGNTVFSGTGSHTSKQVGSYTYQRGQIYGSSSYQQRRSVRRFLTSDQDYERLYTGGPYEGNFQKFYESNFVPGNATNDAGNQQFITQYNAIQTYLRFFTVEEYIANYIRQEDLNYSKDYNVQYVANFENKYTKGYAERFIKTFTGDFTGFTTADYTTNYESTQIVKYIPNYTGAFTGDFAKNYTPNYVTHYTANYQRNYQTNYELTYSGDYTGNFNKSYSGFVEPYVRTYIGNFNHPYERTYTSEYTRKFTRQRTEGFTRTSVVHRTSIYTSPYTTNYSGNYTGTFVGTFTGLVEQAYASISTRQFEKNFEGNYSGFVDPFTTNYEGNFERIYNTEYISNFAMDFQQNYVEEFIGNYTRGRVSTFTRHITIDRPQAYEGNFTGDFIRTYDAAYENFVTPFEGEYAGLTIQNAQETVETYTLYVRQS